MPYPVYVAGVILAVYVLLSLMCIAIVVPVLRRSREYTREYLHASTQGPGRERGPQDESPH